MNLKRLNAKSKQAALVYMHLLNIAGKRQSFVLIMSRDQIGKAIGINRRQTIYKALKALCAEGLILCQQKTRQKNGVTKFRFYKISLRKVTKIVTHDFDASQGTVTKSVTHQKVASFGKVTNFVTTLCREADGFVSTTPPLENDPPIKRTPEEIRAAMSGTQITPSAKSAERNHAD